MYKAVIYFDTEEDSYTEGEIGNSGTSWNEILTAGTKKELRDKIVLATYSRWEEDIELEDINGYSHAHEYHTSYMANDDNEGEASNSEIEAWKQGNCRLWAVHCHILVSKVTETKALL